MHQLGDRSSNFVERAIRSGAGFLTWRKQTIDCFWITCDVHKGCRCRLVTDSFSSQSDWTIFNPVSSGSTRSNITRTKGGVTAVWRRNYFELTRFNSIQSDLTRANLTPKKYYAVFNPTQNNIMQFSTQLKIILCSFQPDPKKKYYATPNEFEWMRIISIGVRNEISYVKSN